MDIETIKSLLYVLIPAVLGGIGYFMQSILKRIDVLEREVPFKLNETEVRQLLIDKIDPIREDIKDLQTKLDKIVDILLKRQ